MDWLGAWGGMLDGLYLIAELLIEAYNVYFIKAKLLWLLTKILPTQQSIRN